MCFDVLTVRVQIRMCHVLIHYIPVLVKGSNETDTDDSLRNSSVCHSLWRFSGPSARATARPTGRPAIGFCRQLCVVRATRRKLSESVLSPSTAR